MGNLFYPFVLSVYVSLAIVSIYHFMVSYYMEECLSPCVCV